MHTVLGNWSSKNMAYWSCSSVNHTTTATVVGAGPLWSGWQWGGRQTGGRERTPGPVDRACGRGLSDGKDKKGDGVWADKTRETERLRDVYRGELRETEEASLPRQDRVNLTRPSLGRWRAMVGRTEDLTWRLCQMREGNAEHLWLECGALEDLRRRHQVGRSMAELVERPLQACAMLGSILSRLGWSTTTTAV